MAARQFHARVTVEEDALFKEYAASLGLDKSSLASLLLVRFVERRGLEGLRITSSPMAARQTKITAHVRSQEVAAAFDAQLAAIRCTASQVCAFVFLKELEERWLFRAVRNSFDSD